MVFDVALRVLVIDDDGAIRSALDQALRRDYRVDTSASIADARLRLESESDLALVLCEAGVGGRHGAALLAELSSGSHPTSPRMLFMTDGAHAEDDEALRHACGGHLLRKPFGVAELLATVAARLRQVESAPPIGRSCAARQPRGQRQRGRRGPSRDRS